MDVSVVIPTFNRSTIVARAIRSALANKLPGGLEIVVVDDGSTDRTQSVLEGLGNSIRPVRHLTNLGRAAARNTGLKKSAGRYVKFLDSDDVLEPGSLETEVALADNTNADIVASGWATVDLDEHGAAIPGTRKDFHAPDFKPMPDALLEGKAVPTSAALYRQDHVRELRWNAEIKLPDDWHFFVQAALRARTITRNEEIAYQWCSHPGERVTGAFSVLQYACDHHKVLDFMFDFLDDRDQLSAHRKRLLAQYYYKQIYVLALHDRRSFDRAVAKIRTLDPDFRPDTFEARRTMKALARLIGFRNAVLLFTRVKRFSQRVRNPPSPMSKQPRPTQ